MSKCRPDVDCLQGEWRRPHNDLQEQEVGGGHKAIHDDETAAAAGFSGAPIHGTVHWSSFTPLLLDIFGQEWFERGTISVSFKNIVTHLQPVKAFIEKPAAGQQQVMIWMEHVDGQMVLDGTASVCDGGETMVDQQIARIKPVGGQLVFIPQPIGTKTVGEETAEIKWGEPIGPLFPFTLDRKLEIITEWHPWFSKEHGGDSPWGRPILPPEALNQILFVTSDRSKWPSLDSDNYLGLPRGSQTPVGLFGGCEVKIHNGPCFVDEPYTVSREMIAVGETPKTEFQWTKSTMHDAAGRLVAEMTLQNMMLKGSVEGYAELRAAADAASPAARL
jgi:hypothetical protein